MLAPVDNANNQPLHLSLLLWTLTCLLGSSCVKCYPLGPPGIKERPHRVFVFLLCHCREKQEPFKQYASITVSKLSITV